MVWDIQSNKVNNCIEELKKKIRIIDKTDKSKFPSIVVEALKFYKSKLDRDITSGIEYRNRIVKKSR